MKPKIFLYACMEEEMFIYPKEEAEYSAMIQDALESCATWREFRSKIRQKDYSELMRYFDGEERPRPDDDFSSDAHPAFEEGDFPPHPSRMAQEWIPGPVVSAFGTEGESMISGPLITFDTNNEKEIVSLFQTLGFRCEKEETLVRKALGYQDGKREVEDDD